MKATWDSAAQETVKDVWVLHNSTELSFSADSESLLLAMRNHLDYLIDYCFGNSMSPDKSEWATLAKFALVSDSSLDEKTVFDTLRKKHRDYGSRNIERFGHSGILIRLNDKVSRLENLFKGDEPAENESVSDTYLDIVGYCVIGMMLEDNSFFLPVK